MNQKQGPKARGHVVLCGLNELGYRTLEDELGRVLSWTEAGVHAARHHP